MSKDKDRFKTVKALTIPPGRLEKVHAHNKFTVVEIEGEDPYVIGDSKLYSQDSSNK
jgi:myosin V